MKRGANDVKLSILGLVACDDADSGVFHFPDGFEHPHAEGEPVEVLCCSSEDAVDIPGSLEVSGKRGTHRAEDNGRDFAPVFAPLYCLQGSGP